MTAAAAPSPEVKSPRLRARQVRGKAGGGRAPESLPGSDALRDLLGDIALLRRGDHDLGGELLDHRRQVRLHLLALVEGSALLELEDASHRHRGLDHHRGLQALGAVLHEPRDLLRMQRDGNDLVEGVRPSHGLLDGREAPREIQDPLHGAPPPRGALRRDQGVVELAPVLHEEAPKALGEGRALVATIVLGVVVELRVDAAAQLPGPLHGLVLCRQPLLEHGLRHERQDHAADALAPEGLRLLLVLAEAAALEPLAHCVDVHHQEPLATGDLHARWALGPVPVDEL
mmetsp:Transcript_102235/g.294303  ORF Transcript_102235/g.294303 Transcript_102235/m.294303 type:complete len:287 (+) Transcript_102235:90-950(+)